MEYFGGKPKAYFSVHNRKEGVEFTYRSYTADTTIFIPVDYSFYQRDLLGGIEEVASDDGECISASYYDMKGGSRLLRRERGGCQSIIL